MVKILVGKKKTSGTPRQMMLEWMVGDGYGNLKEEAQREE